MRLANEIDKRWQEEFCERILAIEEKRIERRMEVYWIHETWWARHRRNWVVKHDYVEVMNLEKSMLPVYRQKYRPFIKELEQEYHIESLKLGGVKVFVGRIYWHRAVHSKK